MNRRAFSVVAMGTIGLTTAAVLAVAVGTEHSDPQQRAEPTCAETIAGRWPDRAAAEAWVRAELLQGPGSRDPQGRFHAGVTGGYGPFGGPVIETPPDYGKYPLPAGYTLVRMKYPSDYPLDRVMDVTLVRVACNISDVVP